MEFTTPDILKGIVLLGCIAHVMIYYNGLWNDVFWLSALIVVAIPVVIYKNLKFSKKKKRSPRLTKEI